MKMKFFHPFDHLELDPALAQRDFLRENPEATDKDFTRWYDALLAAVVEDTFERG